MAGLGFTKKPRMKISDSEWDEKISSLPPNLSLNQAAKQLNTGLNKSTVMRRLRSANYKYWDGRSAAQEIDPKWRSADWSKGDAELAALLGVSKQRVNAMRGRYRKNLWISSQQMTRPIAKFRVYPEVGRYFFTVYVWPDLRSMREATDTDDALAVCCRFVGLRGEG